MSLCLCVSLSLFLSLSLCVCGCYTVSVCDSVSVGVRVSVSMLVSPYVSLLQWVGLFLACLRFLLVCVSVASALRLVQSERWFDVLWGWGWRIWRKGRTGPVKRSCRNTVVRPPRCTKEASRGPSPLRAGCWRVSPPSPRSGAGWRRQGTRAQPPRPAANSSRLRGRISRRSASCYPAAWARRCGGRGARAGIRHRSRRCRLPPQGLQLRWGGRGNPGERPCFLRLRSGRCPGRRGDGWSAASLPGGRRGGCRGAAPRAPGGGRRSLGCPRRWDRRPGSGCRWGRPLARGRPHPGRAGAHRRCGKRPVRGSCHESGRVEAHGADAGGTGRGFGRIGGGGPGGEPGRVRFEVADV